MKIQIKNNQKQIINLKLKALLKAMELTKQKEISEVSLLLTDDKEIQNLK